MGSKNIIHGFSASKPSFSYRLRPPRAGDFTLSRDTPHKSPVTGKTCELPCSGIKLLDHDEGAETDGDGVSEDSIDDDGSLDWEDSVSERALLSINEKETFQMETLQPVIVSRPSLLTTIMNQPAPSTGHPAKTISTGGTRSPPALQQFPIPTEGPSLTTAQEGDDIESTLIMRNLRIPDSELGGATSSSPLFNALSPTTTRENMLADELDESLRGHMHWEHKLKTATTNAVLNRQVKPHRPFVPEDNLSSEKVREKAKSGKGIGFGSGQSSGTGQPHENYLWNPYFDNETPDHHVKGW